MTSMFMSQAGLVAPLVKHWFHSVGVESQSLTCVKGDPVACQLGGFSESGLHTINGCV